MKRILSLLSLLAITACSVRAARADPPVVATSGSVKITVNARLVTNAPAASYQIPSNSFSAAVYIESTHRFICEDSVGGSHSLSWIYSNKIFTEYSGGGGTTFDVEPDFPWDRSYDIHHIENLVAGSYSAQAYSDLSCDSFGANVTDTRSTNVHF